MIYLDNAATGGTKPSCVVKAVSSAIKVCANAGRSGHKLSLACARVVQNARGALNTLFDGYGDEHVVFTKNATEALNTALLGILNEGDEVITTCLEHNSVLRPLEHLKKTRGVTYDVLPRGDLPALFRERATKSTRAAIVTLASNVTGERPPIQKIRAALPKETLLICDGAQACGHFDVKMKESGIDVLAVAGHKGMNGIQGSGALLFSERVDIRPLTFGGTGSDSLLLDQPTFYPDALESGTLNFPAIVSLFEGALYTRVHGKDNERTLLSLTSYLIAALKTRKITLYSEPNEAGIVAFSHSRLASEDVAQILSDDFNIAVRGGLHCAPLMHRALHTQEDGLVRASLSVFNARADCDALASALKSL